MPDFYYKQGGLPQELPYEDKDNVTGQIWTDLAKNPDKISACGWTQAPTQPTFDASAKSLSWNSNLKQWELADIPPAPPAPALTEYYVNKYYFLSRFTTAEKIGFNRSRKKAEALTDADYNAANANPQSQQAYLAAFESFLLTYDALDKINLLDPQMQQALGLFALLGIITQDRIPALLSTADIL